MGQNHRVAIATNNNTVASSFFALFDDIASILDDVSVMTKVAAKKTAGVLGDDLALNAHQVTGVEADRELPIVWAVAKGSFKNKLILVPCALAISAFLPVAVLPLLMIGGAYLCFEGVEKLAGKWLHPHEAHGADDDKPVDENEKIKGAVRTDFILSAEIITISLGTVSDKPLGTQLAVLAGISLLMTVGVYGLVAGIVKLDDLGLALVKRPGSGKLLGGLILKAAPLLMRMLSVVGTIAMFLVGGGIVAHGIPALAEFLHNLEHSVPAGLVTITSLSIEGILGVLVGIAVLAAVTLVGRLRGAR